MEIPQSQTENAVYITRSVVLLITVHFTKYLYIELWVQTKAVIKRISLIFINFYKYLLIFINYNQLNK